MHSRSPGEALCQSPDEYAAKYDLLPPRMLAVALRAWHVGNMLHFGRRVARAAAKHEHTMAIVQCLGRNDKSGWLKAVGAYPANFSMPAMNSYYNVMVSSMCTSY